MLTLEMTIHGEGVVVTRHLRTPRLDDVRAL